VFSYYSYSFNFIMAYIPPHMRNREGDGGGAGGGAGALPIAPAVDPASVEFYAAMKIAPTLRIYLDSLRDAPISPAGAAGPPLAYYPKNLVQFAAMRLNTVMDIEEKLLSVVEGRAATVELGEFDWEYFYVCMIGEFYGLEVRTTKYANYNKTATAQIKVTGEPGVVPATTLATAVLRQTNAAPSAGGSWVYFGPDNADSFTFDSAVRVRFGVANCWAARDVPSGSPIGSWHPDPAYLFEKRLEVWMPTESPGLTMTVRGGRKMPSDTYRKACQLTGVAVQDDILSELAAIAAPGEFAMTVRSLASHAKIT
jgi:hypothetical protein